MSRPTIRNVGRGKLLSLIALAGIFVAALPYGSVSASHNACDHGNPNGVGPICAVLSPPVTTYEVMDVSNIVPDGPYQGMQGEFLSARVFWSETTVSCGIFFPNANGFTGAGPTYDEVSALWSHANQPPDNCSHDAPNHPGSIVATTVISDDSDPEAPGGWVPIGAERCIKETSDSGTGPACDHIPPEPNCLPGSDAMFVNPGGDKAVVGAKEGKVTIDLPGGEMPDCSAPGDDLNSVLVLGDDESEQLEVKKNVFNFEGMYVGINGFGGDDTVTVVGTASADVFNLDVIPPFGGFPEGGFGLDVNGDALIDLALFDVEHLIVKGSDGVDWTHISNEAWDAEMQRMDVGMLGGRGTDWSLIEGMEAADDIKYSFDMGRLNLQNTNGSYGFNISSVERLSIKGLGGSDTIGPIGSFQLPVRLSGGSGDDDLTGGDKNDSFNGGPGTDRCDGGLGKVTYKFCEISPPPP